MKRGFILTLSAVVIIGVVVIAMSMDMVSKRRINEEINNAGRSNEQDLDLRLSRTEVTRNDEKTQKTETIEEFAEIETSPASEFFQVSTENNYPEHNPAETGVPEMRVPEAEVAEAEPPRITPPTIQTPDVAPPSETIPIDMEIPESGSEIARQEETIWIQDISLPIAPPAVAPPQVELSYAQEVVRLVNEERAAVGLAALVLDKEVEAAALVRARETVTNFSHTRPNGSSFSSALTESGISYRGAGENIAYGQSSPEVVVNGWMNSPGHRANILNSSFIKIGVGYYQAGGVNYWTQLFTY